MMHPIDLARERTHLRADLAKLNLLRDEQPKRYARHAEQYDRWRAKLETRKDGDTIAEAICLAASETLESEAAG